ncbi:MAG: glycosyltransferase [Chloroflexi bacterium]|nr:glycosyltransferase [Chloroflexota bacterium]
MAFEGVTFVVPTLNEEARLPRCLESIRAQEYPAECVEIIVADGGSTDGTVDIARSFGARVVTNERRLAEPGVALGMSIASSEYCIAFAADNVLPHSQWLTAMVQPLDDDPCIGLTFTHLVNASNDNCFNQYFNALRADPLNAFVFGEGTRPQCFSRFYRVHRQTKDYTVFSFDEDNFPPIALAQGTTVRRTLLSARCTEYDDILPVIEMIRAGVYMAYVPRAGIHHFSMRGFRDFVHKYDKRIDNALVHGYVRRATFLSPRRRFRQYIWPVYALSVWAPAIYALSWTLKTRQRCYFFHPVANLVLALLIIRRLFALRQKIW